MPYSNWSGKALDLHRSIATRMVCTGFEGVPKRLKKKPKQQQQLLNQYFTLQNVRPYWVSYAFRRSYLGITCCETCDKALCFHPSHVKSHSVFRFCNGRNDDRIYSHTHTYARFAAVLVCRKSHLSMPLVTECAWYKFWICVLTETYKSEIYEI